MEEFKKQCNEDVVTTFVHMLIRLKRLWKSKDVFYKLKEVCKLDMRLSKELRDNLELSDSTARIVDLLAETHFCTWLEIRFLQSMAKAAEIPEATDIITTFKDCVYSKKCSEVINHFYKVYINPDHVTKITTKLNEHAECYLVSQLIEYCQGLESIVQLCDSTTCTTCGKIGCLEVCFVMPKQFHEYAYKVLRSHFLKLRPFNVQYIQIDTFPRIYTTNLTKTMEAKSLLKEILLHDNCKLSNIDMCESVTYLAIVIVCGTVYVLVLSYNLTYT